MNSKIVLIDDELKLLRALKKTLGVDGHTVFDFSDPEKALAFVKKRPPDLVISDIRMKDMSGLDLLEAISLSGLGVPVILMTAYSSVETAVAAVKLGAADYLLKPFETSELKSTVRKVLQPTLKQTDLSRPLLVGRSDAMNRLVEMINRVADTDSTVLIHGESGTGKELVARALHAGSPRAAKPFVPVNCSAIPESLFESELFGHVKGSFTNAYSDKVGLFFEAAGGTMFLDEIGDLPLSSQAKMLRMLQDGSFRQVGDTTPLHADVRIISATHKSLKDEVKSLSFREDLLYRVNVVEIFIPPLRERPEDIEGLAKFFLERFSLKHGRQALAFSDEAFSGMQRYSWPGNVRELENVVERAVIMKRSGIIGLNDISIVAGAAATAEPHVKGWVNLAEKLEEYEERIIRNALCANTWNYSKAAEALGITRQNLNYKLKKFGIRRDSVDR